MSSYADQMDTGESAHSLLSERRSSEVGSQYVVESGVYMSSFAATIFVAALVTVGVLLLTLLVALTVMLESCQSRSSGVFELAKSSSGDDYCNVLAFHAELNNFEADSFPSACLDYAFKYMKDGQYSKDLNLTLQVVESFFSTLRPNNDDSDIILVDADDLLLSEMAYRESSVKHRQVEDMKHLTHLLVLKLYIKLQTQGWSLIPFTRRHMKEGNSVIHSLKTAGCTRYSSLIMRSDDELALENWRYISGRRVRLQKQGFRIVSVISSQMDALTGPCLGMRNFKLAYPIYYRLVQHSP